jgi:hypothetical protein
MAYLPQDCIPFNLLFLEGHRVRQLNLFINFRGQKQTLSESRTVSDYSPRKLQ